MYILSQKEYKMHSEIKLLLIFYKFLFMNMCPQSNLQQACTNTNASLNSKSYLPIEQLVTSNCVNKQFLMPSLVFANFVCDNWDVYVINYFTTIGSMDLHSPLAYSSFLWFLFYVLLWPTTPISLCMINIHIWYMDKDTNNK